MLANGGKLKVGSDSATPPGEPVPPPDLPGPVPGSLRAIPGTSRNLRVLLADGHHIVAAGIAALLDREPDLEVVGTVRNGREAVKLALQLTPDVVAMDFSIPRLCGIEATRQIAHARPAIKILCLSTNRERQSLAASLEAGASGYILKHSTPEVLGSAIRSVAGGKTYLCPEMTAAAVDELRANLVGHRPVIDPVLSGREREVLQLVAEGLTSCEIAAQLGISERTVATHRRNLAEKLAIHSIAGLTKYAIRHGLTTIDGDQRETR